MPQPTIRRYSFALKKYVVDEIENGRMSIAEARRRYAIGGNNTIYRWLGQFGKHPRTATKVYVQMKHEKNPLAQRDEENCYHVYTKWLTDVGAWISMAEVGNPYENAQAERVNGILKHEYGLGGIFAIGVQTRASVLQAIYLYNEERPHLSLCYQKPNQVHAQKRRAA